MREEQGKSWIAETREALTGSTSVVVLHGNLDDIYYTDMHQGMLRLARPGRFPRSPTRFKLPV